MKIREKAEMRAQNNGICDNAWYDKALVAHEVSIKLINKEIIMNTQETLVNKSAMARKLQTLLESFLEACDSFNDSPPYEEDGGEFDEVIRTLNEAEELAEQFCK